MLLSAVALAWLGASGAALAGPPYATDDPEPIPYHHWELYVSSQHEVTRAGASGLAPFGEANFGVLPDLQLHIIVPLAYSHDESSESTAYGAGDVEVGAKFRFVQEGELRPMVGTYPMFELPVGSATRGLGAGRLRVFVPLWLQKSFGPWTTYGGPGYWLHPGPGNKNYWYLGSLLQRRLSPIVAPGVEIFYTTADTVGGSGNLRFNVGVVLDLTPNHHLLLSAGRSLVGDTLFQAYAGYLFTI